VTWKLVYYTGTCIERLLFVMMVWRSLKKKCKKVYCRSCMQMTRAWWRRARRACTRLWSGNSVWKLCSDEHRRKESNAWWYQNRREEKANGLVVELVVIRLCAQAFWNWSVSNVVWREVCIWQAHHMLGFEPVILMISKYILRWFGHVEFKDQSDTTAMEVEVRQRGCLRKTWLMGVKMWKILAVCVIEIIIVAVLCFSWSSYSAIGYNADTLLVWPSTHTTCAHLRWIGGL